MKSAEEWIQWNTHCPNGKNVVTKPFSPADIKQIQLDAYKEGMSEAAEIAKAKVHLWDNQSAIAASRLNDEILSARDKKETI